MKCISFKQGSFSLPMQVLPSPEKPLKQEQQYEPWVLMQLALKSHNCPGAVHSSTSGTNRQLHLHIYTFNLGKTFKRQISLRTGLNRKKKSLCHVTMVANFLDLNKPCNWSCKYGREKKKRKINLYDLRLCMFALKKKKTVAK